MLGLRMPKLTMTKRQACITAVLAALVIISFIVLKRSDYEVSEAIASINQVPQPPSGSIADQNKWNASDFFTEPSAENFCNLIAVNDSAKIDELIRSEAVNLNCLGKSGMTPLLWAYSCGRKELVIKLLQAGANPDTKLLQSIPVKYGTPLLDGDTFAFTMLRHMDIDMLNECLRFIRDPNQRDRHGDSLLHKLIGQIAFNSAPGERFKKLTEGLIEIGVDVNARNSNGSTPLHIAFNHLPEFGPLLLDHGADPTITSNDGKSVLDTIDTIETYLPTDKLRHDEALLRYSAFVDRLRNYRD